MEDPLPFLLLALTLPSALFSLCAASLSLFRKSRLRLIAAERKNKRALEALEDTEPLIFSLRVWNLLSHLAAVFLLLDLFGNYSLLQMTGPFALTALLFIAVTECIPRLAAASWSEEILHFCLPLLIILGFPWKFLFLAAAALPCFSRRSGETGDSAKVEFNIALDEGEKSGAVEKEERSMVEGVLYLGDRPVSAIMTRRSEIEWLQINEDPGSILEKISANRTQGFFPVVSGTQDDIAGVASTADLLLALLQREKQNEWKGLSAVMKMPRFVPETMSALKAFEAFKQSEEYYLCVMDEYGGFAGSLRLRDLVEEIVGEMATGELVKQEDGGYLADGSLSIDALAAQLPEFEAPEAEGREYHTLAGFILKVAKEIPRCGAFFDQGAYRFTVVDLDGNRIDKILIRKLAGGQ
ncbi:MAG: hemolysin family protein [Treponema sp.]|jgi:putative hemolysin|nr:hemolysin family protein [Treponema sp.]